MPDPFRDIAFIAAYGTGAQLPPSTLPEIIFAGRSNVGKSSLINKLFSRRNLARTSSTPGKTGTVNFYRAADVYYVDLPGYGYAKVSGTEQQRWADLMEHFFAGERNIVLAIQLIDMRHPPTALDLQMAEFLMNAGLPMLIALTKSDKLNRTQREARLARIQDELPALLPETQIIPFSAVGGEGVDEIKEKIMSTFEANKDQR